MNSFSIYQDLYFTTASIFNKEPIFKTDQNITCIYECLDFLAKEERAIIYSFCIMSNHIHLVWEILDPWSLEKCQHSLLSYSSKGILSNLKSPYKEKFLVNKADRKYQVWKRNPLSVEISRNSVLQQKMNYIHNNPINAKLVKRPEDYLHSSFASYLSGEPQFNFLTLW